MNRTTIRNITLLLAALTVPAQAQMGLQDRFSANVFVAKAFIPSVTGTLATKTVYVDAIVLTNTTGSSVTVRIRDRSTDCNSAACPILPDDIVVNALSTYSIPLYKLEATSGITWSASVANSVVGRIVGVY